MPTTTTPPRDDAQIRESIDAWARALRAKDIRTLMEHYAPDMVTFDLMPLQLQGAERINGRRMVTHEHVSMPFISREALQAALALPRG